MIPARTPATAMRLPWLIQPTVGVRVFPYAAYPEPLAHAAYTHALSHVMAPVDAHAGTADLLACLGKDVTVHMDEWIAAFSVDGALLATASGDTEGAAQVPDATMPVGSRRQHTTPLCRLYRCLCWTVHRARHSLTCVCVAAPCPPPLQSTPCRSFAAAAPQSHLDGLGDALGSYLGMYAVWSVRFIAA